MVDPRSSVKPPLLLRDLRVGRTFRTLEFSVTPELVDAFCNAVGDENPLFRSVEAARSAGYPTCVAPPGLAGIFGRQAYLGDYSMPAGGVLAGQTIEFHSPGFVGDQFRVDARVVDLLEKKGRPRVTIESTARRAAGEIVAVVRIVAMWPSDPPSD